MRHRGPDGSGAYRHQSGERHCLLLHTRLSILDLDERAAQPMRYGGHVISFNGEVYNYLEVRQGLEAAGERFDTTGDTEVLLRKLALDGADGLGGLDGLDQCEGMWAFALYNEADVV